MTASRRAGRGRVGRGRPGGASRARRRRSARSRRAPRPSRSEPDETLAAALLRARGAGRARRRTSKQELLELALGAGARSSSSPSCSTPRRAGARSPTRELGERAKHERLADAAASARCARNSSRSERVSTPTGLPSRATTTAFVPPVSVANTSSSVADASTAASGGCIAAATSSCSDVGVREDALEQRAVLERADHVGERLALAVAHDRQLRDAVALHRVDPLADLLRARRS